MNKKNLIVLLTILLMAVFISACGGSSNQNDDADNNNENNVADDIDNDDNKDNNSHPDNNENGDKENDDEEAPNNDDSDSETEEANNANYENYENGRFGFSIDYPTSFESDYTPDNNDGIELHDDEAKIIASGSHSAYTKDSNINASDIDSIKGVFDDKITDLKDDNYSISYQKLDEENNWFVISYVDEENIVYKKTILAEDFFAELTIEYPEDSQDKYEFITGKVADSFTINESNTEDHEENDEITEDEAIENVNKYIEEHEDYDDVSAMVDREEDGKFHIRVFENHSDHIATLGWYMVDKETGEVEAKD